MRVQATLANPDEAAAARECCQRRLVLPPAPDGCLARDGSIHALRQMIGVYVIAREGKDAGDKRSQGRSATPVKTGPALGGPR